MRKKKEEYGNSSISILEGADRVRKRPGVIFGSDDIDGCTHGFFEILSNSTDEAKAGYGKEIHVVQFKNGELQIEDFGRGIPLDWNPKVNRYNWELVYCELYAGGKYEDSESYQYSLGLNGLGACATQYASDHFDVISYRDGYEYSMHFEKGVPVGELKKKKSKTDRTGTIQKWLPDKDVFTDIDIPSERIQAMLKKQAVVNAGIKYTLYTEEDDKSYEYYYEEGILGYVKELNHDSGITSPFLFHGEGRGKDREDKPEYSVVADVAFCMNNRENQMEYYHNSSWLEHGGSPDKAVKLAFVFAFDKEMRARNKYNKNEAKITFSDIQESLIIVTNSFSTATSYENQTKKAINNKFIQSFMYELIRDNLAIWFVENKQDGDKAIEQVLINKRSRENSEQQRQTVKKKLMQQTDVTNKVKKFVDCRSKNAAERELFIVEGDSALGSVKQGRDASFQAIMPIRGKILNCAKADINSIFKSDIITDLIRVLGCGVEVNGKHMAKDMLAFDLENLKYSKVIFLTDEDVDGFHIRVLLLTMIYRLCPQLIHHGKIFIGETPLYEINYRNGKKEERFFAFSDAERDAYIKNKDKSKLKIQRSKGLGENDPDVMGLFMNPKTRKLTKVNAEDAERMAEYFDLFMGNKVEPRKEYIMNNADKYTADLDLS